MKLNIANTFNTELPADPNTENSRRQVVNACFSYVKPKQTKSPELLHVSQNMLKNIGLNQADANTPEFLNVFTGNTVLEHTKPYAMCYGGHQFGSWAGQLGDGRAINLAEVVHSSNRWALQLKGAGPTPYSRTADGLAVLRSSIREYLCSEAMHYLGVPTTRALSLALTGDDVLRDMMYDGNPEYEKGAVVCRVSPSFIRFGSFEIFAARNDKENLKKLANYTIKHFYPHLGNPSKSTYVAFFKEVATKTLNMVIDWQRVGFVHGVMNTDNMSILGLTIDYGPYGWLEGYDLGWTPNTTDSTNKRYRYGAQPEVALWNLFQLANALYPLIEEAEPLEAVLEHYKTQYQVKVLDMMRAKLGLFSAEENDDKLIENLNAVLQLTETDFTIFFRNLSQFDSKSFKTESSIKDIPYLMEAFYKPNEVTQDLEKEWNTWLNQYGNRLVKEDLSSEERRKEMNALNPKYVLRNYMAQLAIDDADKGDYKLIDELYQVLKKPYDEQPENEKWFAKRPEWARHKVGCSMLSCSS